MAPALWSTAVRDRVGPRGRRRDPNRLRLSLAERVVGRLGRCAVLADLGDCVAGHLHDLGGIPADVDVLTRLGGNVPEPGQ